MYFTDYLFNHFTRETSQLNEQQMQTKLDEINKTVFETSLPNLENRNPTETNSPFYKQYQYKRYAENEIDVTELSTDDLHMPPNGKKMPLRCLDECVLKGYFKPNEKIPCINETASEYNTKVNFIVSYFEFFDKNSNSLPIVVKRSSNNNYEILMGNHRVGAYLRKKHCRIKVLLIL
ncbi:MAG: hypothetical protein WC792_02635 [Candidatus Micrarchaeia archaeon]